MTISIFIVTHDQIGQELLKTVATMLDLSQLAIQIISIPSDITASQQPEFTQKVISAMAENNKDEILILCDLYGATPYNLIKHLSQQDNTQVLTGLNLGMLLKAAQMTQQPLAIATPQIMQSAQKSIILE
jgi:mannose/fructose-specific phosphotransferase system component IIA